MVTFLLHCCPILYRRRVRGGRPGPMRSPWDGAGPHGHFSSALLPHTVPQAGEGWPTWSAGIAAMYATEIFANHFWSLFLPLLFRAVPQAGDGESDGAPGPLAPVLATTRQGRAGLTATLVLYCSVTLVPILYRRRARGGRPGPPGSPPCTPPRSWPTTFSGTALSRPANGWTRTATRRLRCPRCARRVSV
jgi:hypothetical protein